MDKRDKYRLKLLHPCNLCQVESRLGRMGVALPFEFDPVYIEGT